MAERNVDFTIIGLEKDSTVIGLRTPSFGDAVLGLFAQLDFWREKPKRLCQLKLVIPKIFLRKLKESLRSLIRKHIEENANISCSRLSSKLKKLRLLNSIF